MKRKKVKNFDAVRDIDVGDIPQTASAFEATGMMYKPAHNNEEYESLRQMHGLQAPYMEDYETRDRAAKSSGKKKS